MNRLRLSTLSLTMAIVVMTLGYATPSFAAKPGACDQDPPHPSCKTGDDTDGAAFNVDIGASGDALQGGSGGNPWLQGVGGKNSIGLNDASPAGLDVGTLTGVAALTDEDTTCFPTDFLSPHTASFQLHQAFIKSGKKGRAEASFWFHGKTFLDDVRVLYLLKLFGEFESGKEWPGAQTLTMTDWELKVENEGKAIKMISCQGEGKVGGIVSPSSITIIVTEET